MESIQVLKKYFEIYHISQMKYENTLFQVLYITLESPRHEQLKSITFLCYLLFGFWTIEWNTSESKYKCIT